MRTFMCRVGMSVNIGENEYTTLCGKDRGAASRLLAKLLCDPKRSRIDGNAYFPEEAQYEYGFEETQDRESSPAICDFDFDL